MKEAKAVEEQTQDVYFHDGMEIMCDGGDPIIETPAEVSPVDPSEPTGKTINISGKSFNVSDDVAQALTEQNQSIDRRFDERAQELGELRQYKTSALQREQAVQEATHKQVQPDLGTMMYEDPDGFVSLIEKKIAKSEEKMTGQYLQEKSSEKAQVDFWNSMWAENEDLARVKPQATDIISMISQKYQQQYPNLKNTKEVRDAFANDARAWMKGIVGNSNGTFDPANFMEGSSTQRELKGKKTEEEPRDGHTKRILSKSRERKRQAMMNPGLK